MFGRRRDGKRVKNLDGMHVIFPHIKPNRCDSDVYINQKMNVTKLVDYMENLKKENSEITYFHLFSTVIAKTIYNKPLLNRFVVNKLYYDRNNVSIGFSAKVDFKDESKELLSVIDIKPEDNLFTIKDKILNAVNKVRNSATGEVMI